MYKETRLRLKVYRKGCSLQVKMLEDLQLSFSDKDTSVVSLNESLQQATNQMETYAREVTELRKQLSDSQQNAELAERKLGEQNQKLLSLAENMQEVEAQLNTTAEDSEAKQTTIQEANQTIESLTKATQEKDEKILKITEEMSEKDTQAKKYVALIKKLKLQMKKMQEESKTSEVGTSTKLQEREEELQNLQQKQLQTAENLESALAKIKNMKLL